MGLINLEQIITKDFNRKAPQKKAIEDYFNGLIKPGNIESSKRDSKINSLYIDYEKLFTFMEKAGLNPYNYSVFQFENKLEILTAKNNE